jgi:hypothetical protein
MKMQNSILTAGLVACVCWFTACASSPPAAKDTAPQEQTAATATPLQPPASSPDLWASKQSKKGEHVWTVPTDAELTKLDKKYLDATTGYVKLKKDGALMFCKRYRVIGSNIATIQCLSEGEMRTQVDDMTKYRDDMRNKSGKCTMNVGCGAGF